MRHVIINGNLHEIDENDFLVLKNLNEHKGKTDEEEILRQLENIDKISKKSKKLCQIDYTINYDESAIQTMRDTVKIKKAEREKEYKKLKDDYQKLEKK